MNQDHLMKTVLMRELRVTNSRDWIRLHLECGHTRSFIAAELRNRPRNPKCFCIECEREEKAARVVAVIKTRKGKDLCPVTKL